MLCLLISVNMGVTDVHAEETKEEATVEKHDWDSYQIDTSSTTRGYDSLTKSEKAIYRKIYDASRKYLTTTDDFIKEGKAWVMESIPCGDVEPSRLFQIYSTVREENPQFYFFGNSISVTTYNGSNTSLKIVVKSEYADGEERAKFTNRLFRELDSWLSIINSFDTRYERVRAANEILCKEYTYTLTDTSDNDLSVILRKKTPCRGYAYSMYFLMNYADVPVYMVLHEDEP